MPIVPRVNPAPLPNVRLTAEPLNRMVPEGAFGGGSGDALAGVGEGLSQLHKQAAEIAQEEQTKALQIANTDNAAQLSAIKTNRLYGPDGALTKQGKDAFDTPETVRQQYFSDVGQIRAGITNDAQRDAFDGMVARGWSQMDEQVQQHVAQQRRVYDTSTVDALVANKQNEALNGYTDPATVDGAIADQTGAITGYGARNGWSDDQTKQAVAKQVSATRFGVLSRFLDTEQDLAAGKYLQQHRDDFAGDDLMRAEKLVEVGTVRGESQRQADDITNTSASLAEALKEVGDIPDPRVRDATEQRVRRHYEDEAADQRQARAQAFTQASAIIEQSGGQPDKVPLSLRTQLSPEENEALDHRAEQIRNPKVTTNLSTYTHLINMSALNDATRAQFGQTDLSQYRGQLSDEDYKHLLGLQRSARLGEERTADAAATREESRMTKAFDAAREQNAGTDALRARMKAQGKSDADINKIPPPTAPRLIVPQWYLDSAQANPDGRYGSYLRAHDQPLTQPTASAAQAPAPGAPAQQPQRPAVPGAPLPKRTNIDPASFGLQPQPPAPPKRSVTIKRDSAGRVIGLHQE